MISKRWSKLFVYLLPVLLMATYVGMLFKISVLSTKEGEEDKDTWSLKKHQELQIEMVAIGIGFFAYLILFCPNVVFLVCFYFPIYAVTHLT